MRITKRQLRKIIREEKDKLNELAGISEDPLASLGLALEAALREAQKLQGPVANEIELELEGLLEKLHGL